MLPTSARLLRLLSLLQSRRFWAGGELAVELGVTERSVRRDVDRLRSLGYPVHAAAGVGGGYELGAGKELPPLPLEDDEAVAVAIGLRAAASGPVKGLEDASVRALVKLEKVLPKRLRKRVNALESVSVKIHDAAPRVDAEVLSVIASACRESVLLEFDHQGRDGESKSRSVEPYRLVHTSHRWYLLAWDRRREDWRTFRVDRIGPGVRPGKSFAARELPAKDVAAYVSQSVSTEAYRFRARVRLHAPARVVTEKLSGLAARVEELDSRSCLMHTGANSLEGLALYIGMMGFDFEVLEPPELVACVREVAARMQRACSAPPPLLAPRMRARTAARPRLT